MVRGGLIAATVAMVGSAVSTHFWAFLLSRFLLGLGSGAVSPAIRRIIVNASRDELGTNLGRLAAFEISGFVLGPLVAAVTDAAVRLARAVLLPGRSVPGRPRGTRPG